MTKKSRELAGLETSLGDAWKPPAEGISYQATYAPTARLGQVMLALAIAAKDDLEIHQMDVCTASLGVDQEEEIYMHPPQGYFRLVQTGSRYYDPRSKSPRKMVLRL
jgi:hypothetical protein